MGYHALVRNEFLKLRFKQCHAIIDSEKSRAAFHISMWIRLSENPGSLVL